MATPPPDDTTGLTRDAGWQIGVQRSVPVPVEKVWEFLMSPAGLAVWLGPGASLSPEEGWRYRTEDGIAGEIRSYHPSAKIRLTWQPAGYADPRVLQIALTSNATGTAIRVHQERLADSQERSQMRDHWRRVLDDLEEGLGTR